MSESGRINKLTFTTKLSKNLLTNVKVNWLNLRKTSYIAAAIMVVIAIASLFTNGLNQGIDFTGGRNYVVRFNENVNTEEIEAHLQDGFKDASVSVITIGTDNQVRISTNYKINDDNKAVDDEIESILYTELQELFANQGVTKEMFVNGYVLNEGKASLAIDDDAQTFGIQSSQKVSAAIADDIKLDASIAILLSILGICLYILARFRNISYSAGALFALIHDVIFIIGAYSLLYKIMPFSMEIDQSFIAAILTIVGYSINDKVVVFDRVREMVNLYPKRDKAEVINEAVNATLIRTLSTSLSTALVLVVILLLGGETIRGFVFAMLLGVIVGTYSTIFVAVPSAYDFIKKGEAKKLKPVKK
jgi:SecD/SecF fusion protein